MQKTNFGLKSNLTSRLHDLKSGPSFRELFAVLGSSAVPKSYNNIFYGNSIIQKLTTIEKETIKDFYRRVEEYAVPYKQHPYLKSTYSKMNSIIRYGSNDIPKYVIQELKLVKKFLNCVKCNMEGTEQETQRFMDEADSYMILFKLSYE